MACLKCSSNILNVLFDRNISKWWKGIFVSKQDILIQISVVYKDKTNNLIKIFFLSIQLQTLFFLIILRIMMYLAIQLS
jgi:hypothetical protein